MPEQLYPPVAGLRILQFGCNRWYAENLFWHWTDAAGPTRDSTAVPFRVWTTGPGTADPWNRGNSSMLLVGMDRDHRSCQDQSSLKSQGLICKDCRNSSTHSSLDARCRSVLHHPANPRHDFPPHIHRPEIPPPRGGTSAGHRTLDGGGDVIRTEGEGDGDPSRLPHNSVHITLIRPSPCQPPTGVRISAPTGASPLSASRTTGNVSRGDH
jgi:hypothetical protein